MKHLNDKLGLLLEHLFARKDPRSKDDGDDHAQRGDNASLIRPRLNSGGLLCNHGAGDAEIVDIAENEGHVCPGDADDQEMEMGSTNQTTPTVLVMAKKPLRMAEAGGMSPKTTGEYQARERNRGAAPPRW